MYLVRRQCTFLYVPPKTKSVPLLHHCTFLYVPFRMYPKDHFCTPSTPLYLSVCTFPYVPPKTKSVPLVHHCTFPYVPFRMYPKDHFCTLVAQLYLFDCTSKITNMYTLKRLRIGRNRSKHISDRIKIQ